jgi:hypothetical protein
MASRWLLLLALPVLVGLLGCAAAGVARPGSRFAVAGGDSQFYKYGPAQAFGADATLPKGEKVTLIKQDFGFSQVRRENNETGYIATDALRLLPPDPVRPTPKTVAAKRRSGSPRAKPAPEPQLDLTDLPSLDLPTH